MPVFTRVLRRTAFGAACFAAGALLQSETPLTPITRDAIAHAEALLGLSFTDAQRDMMRDGLKEQRESIEALRRVPLPNSVAPSLEFNPLPHGFRPETARRPLRLSPVQTAGVPSNPEDLAYLSVRELGQLLRSRRLTSEALTRLSLDRLKRHGPALQAVVTLTEDLALAQARAADREIAAGRYRGPLHGIPYGAKDLLATKDIPTTWGAAPFRRQVFDEDATVVRKLREAGAVLVAKLTLGELAMGDVWFGGKTRNPWNREQGSSGSSAGSAAATAAGLVPFAIGTETLGSIVSPASRCGVTGLRPTFGRVSRHGAMALSWSMDKIGPICRHAEDCAVVFDAIRGPDGKDTTVRDAPFNYDGQRPLRSLRIGYLRADFEKATRTKEQNEAALAVLRRLGVSLVEVRLPERPAGAMLMMLEAEAAAAFDELTRSGRDAELVQQGKDNWPNLFRVARLMPAVEYIQASRARRLLIEDMARVFDSVDVYVAPTGVGANLLVTNLTGHPTVVMPHGFTREGAPTSISVVGGLYGEANALAVARAFQGATEHHRKRPTL